jgi:flagellar hook-associated protein 2
MGSPITLSGFNKIDFNMILSAVMEQERAPIRTLEAQKKSFETQNTAFGTFAGKLATLESAVKALADVTSLAKLSATTSDSTAVGVSTTSGTVAGTYDVVVSELAKAQVTSSTSTYASLDDVVATSGTLSLLKSGNPPVDIVVTGSMTIQQLADAINASSSAPVAASVVQAAPGQYRLVLTGKSTGTANAFTMTSSLSGGSGLTFTDTDSDGVYGDSSADNSQNAINASLTVNNVAISSASNTITDAVPGVTLTLLKKDPTKTITVTSSRDNTAAADLLNAFAKAYNDVVTFVKDQTAAAVSGKPSIGRDSVVRGFKEALGTKLSAEYTVGGTFTRLASIGLEFDVQGKLSLNKTVFDTALASSSTDVQKLFAGTDGTGGAFGTIKTLVKEYTQSGGQVPGAQTRLNDQVKNLRNRLDVLESQLAVRRTALQKQFIAADMAMSRLNSQGSSLSQLGGQYRLF